ncbi:flavodoxin family protein [Calderihabitans maritimus]|uniref:NADPH-dependent FMN reductase n=1 Tax=Calderihabitans maritimus TaxID=1246530 RepID=A0A1Z5HQ84_9FIRM|nr:flavodoxin family protein [Calderihabitans maritimus]GAW91465.1 NADPH-dependent FMN reductase [Calderihabitans maritimus]
MQILGIVASKRRLGNSDVLVREALEQAREAGAETEILYLDEYDLKGCRGCLACAYKGRCSLEDDMAVILEKLWLADGLVFAAPTYIFSPVAVVKALTDRALMLSPRLKDLEKRRRKAVTISVAGNPRWNPLGLEFLNQMVLAYGFSVLRGLEAYAPGPGEVLLQPELIAQVREAASFLVESLTNPQLSEPAAEPNQCPVCRGRVFRITSTGDILCPICLTRGRITGKGSNLSLEFEPGEEHFWTPQHRQEHLVNWILETRKRFRENLKAVKEAQKKYKEE